MISQTKTAMGYTLQIVDASNTIMGPYAMRRVNSEGKEVSLGTGIETIDSANAVVADVLRGDQLDRNYIDYCTIRG
jgi:hypothetical protein